MLSSCDLLLNTDGWIICVFIIFSIGHVVSEITSYTPIVQLEVYFL